MSDSTYLVMQKTEMEVFHAASRIYSAMIQVNLVSEAQKHQAMEVAVKDAIKLAQLTDDLVSSPEEAERRNRRY